MRVTTSKFLICVLIHIFLASIKFTKQFSPEGRPGRKNWVLWHISKWFFSPVRSRRVFSLIFNTVRIWSDSLPGGTSHNIVGAPHDWFPLDVFNSQSCPHSISSNLSIIVQLFLSQHCFQRQFLLVGLRSSNLVINNSLYSAICFSNLGSSGLPHVLPYFMDPRRIMFSFLLVRTEWWRPIPYV